VASHRVSGDAVAGFSLSCCTMLLWGLLPLALEVLLETLDPVTLTAFRFAGAAAVLLPVLAWRGALAPLRSLPDRAGLMLAVATVFLAANYLLYLLGLDRTNAATAQVLIQAAPMLLALGGIVVFRERFERGQWLGLAVLLVGMAGFFSTQLLALAAEASRYVLGTALMGAAAVTWAIYGLAQKQLLVWLPSQTVMVCIYSGCAVLFAIGASPAALAAQGEVAWALLLFTAANTLVGYGTFAAALEHWEASRVSAVLALTPMATLGFTALGAELWPRAIDADIVTVPAVVSACVVVAGSLGVALGGRSSGSVPRE
jgi:drug/metabolite transporter (DMT)-like permease